MSVELVLEEIQKFLSRGEAEALCIRGKWGVGKTFAWNAQMKAAQAAKKISRSYYAYVSLFGLNSLEELKFSIFENGMSLSEDLRAADLKSLDAQLSRNFNWRHYLKFTQSWPMIGKFVSGNSMVLATFMTVRNMVICIDDIERRGKGLDLQDVLGLISYLKEQRNCKIALILNDEQLEVDDRKSFDKNLEKVVDISLFYDPPAATSVEIAIPDRDLLTSHVANRCEVLGIKNIRILRRIQYYVAAIRPLLMDFDPEVLKVAASEIALLSWSYDQPDDAPSYSFLKDLALFSDTNSKKQYSEKEISWVALLRAYGFIEIDEFDAVLMEGIVNGYFDPTKVRNAAGAVQQRVLSNRSVGSLSVAWQAYRYSFSDDADKVLDDIYQAFKSNLEYVSPGNLDDFVILFKQLGRRVQAQEMLDMYLAYRANEPDYFDVLSPSANRIFDPEVLSAFAAMTRASLKEQDVATWMRPLNEGWPDERIRVLAAAPVSEYKSVLKSQAGAGLTEMISELLLIDRIPNATPQMREIAQRTRDALKEIGAESKINSLRVRFYGVIPDEPNDLAIIGLDDQT